MLCSSVQGTGQMRPPRAIPPVLTPGCLEVVAVEWPGMTDRAPSVAAAVGALVDREVVEFESLLVVDELREEETSGGDCAGDLGRSTAMPGDPAIVTSLDAAAPIAVEKSAVFDGAP